MKRQEQEKLKENLDHEVQMVRVATQGDLAFRNQEEIAKQLQQNTDNIILNYLFARQKILMDKFQEFTGGTQKSFGNF